MDEPVRPLARPSRQRARKRRADRGNRTGTGERSAWRGTPSPSPRRAYCKQKSGIQHRPLPLLINHTDKFVTRNKNPCGLSSK